MAMFSDTNVPLFASELAKAAGSAASVAATNVGDRPRAGCGGG